MHNAGAFAGLSTLFTQSMGRRDVEIKMLIEAAPQ